MSAIVLSRSHRYKGISLPRVAVMAEGFSSTSMHCRAAGKSLVCLPKKASPHGFEFSYFFPFALDIKKEERWQVDQNQIHNKPSLHVL